MAAVARERRAKADRTTANELRRRQYAKEAPNYDRGSDLTERWLLGTEHRAWVCSRAVGHTLEVAIGTGLNLPYYPPGIRLTGLDLTPQMMSGARRRASELGTSLELVEGDAQALPFADGSFDTVVCTYAMCSVPDERETVQEMRRVLRPRGRLILLDHIRSSVRPLFWLQRLWERAPGHLDDDMTRRPREHVEAAGFRIEAADRLRAGVLERLVARKP
jgi:ubiquinone/menaquinone biosynthesis C-methylase UbiE